MTASVNEVLRKVQVALRAPKGQFNKFGGYRYRSAEDICTAIKPLIQEHAFTLTTPTTIIEVAGRVYVQATARFSVGGESIEVTAAAREPQTRKGMDESQITGATHSYAVKYALSALLLLDDTKDADAHEPPRSNEHKQHEEAIDASDLDEIISKINGAADRDTLTKVMDEIDAAAYSKAAQAKATALGRARWKALEPSSPKSGRETATTG